MKQIKDTMLYTTLKHLNCICIKCCTLLNDSKCNNQECQNFCKVQEKCKLASINGCICIINKNENNNIIEVEEIYKIFKNAKINNENHDKISKNFDPEIYFINIDIEQYNTCIRPSIRGEF